MINIASIIHNDGINGPGLRCTVFVQGCKRKCVGCHSQHTWEFGTGVDYSADDLIDECRKKDPNFRPTCDIDCLSYKFNAIDEPIDPKKYTLKNTTNTLEITKKEVKI